MREEGKQTGTILVILELAQMEIPNGGVYKAHPIAACSAQILLHQGQHVVGLMIGPDLALRPKHLSATVGDLADLTSHYFVELGGLDTLAPLSHHVRSFRLFHSSHLKKVSYYLLIF